MLQPGTRQLAAGYAIYGPSTQVVITVGRGTHGFTLDREIGNFVLTHPDIRVPEEGSDYLINASNRRFWEPPITRYVDECKAGKEGPRGRDFNTRWVASMVADVHRILMRGGIYMYPRDQKEANREGRLRLLYEANPMAMIVEQAGGAASTGRGRILEVTPERLHQRVPVILGSQRRGRARRALPRGVRPGRGQALQLAAVRRALAVHQRLSRTTGADSHVGETPHHRGDRL